jgi:hypothetical protein
MGRLLLVRKKSIKGFDASDVNLRKPVMASSVHNLASVLLARR